MTDLPSNGYKVGTRRIPLSQEHPPPYEGHGWASATGVHVAENSYSSLLHRMPKSSPTHTGPKILCRTFLSNTLKAAESVLDFYISHLVWYVQWFQWCQLTQETGHSLEKWCHCNELPPFAAHSPWRSWKGRMISDLPVWKLARY